LYIQAPFGTRAEFFRRLFKPSSLLGLNGTT
jgi:hypothetical protein